MYHYDERRRALRQIVWETDYKTQVYQHVLIKNPVELIFGFISTLTLPYLDLFA